MLGFAQAGLLCVLKVHTPVHPGALRMKVVRYAYGGQADGREV
jgi:hypothetical protein